MEEDKVEWGEFYEGYMKNTGISGELKNTKYQIDSMKVKGLKAILTEKGGDEGEEDSSSGKGGEGGVVTLENFGKVVSYFGPMTSNGTDLINAVEDVIQRLWFHGDLDSDKTEVKLKGKPAGTFLVRYSSSPGCFTISKKEESRRVKQYRVARKGAEFELNGKTFSSLEELLKTNGKALGLKAPCPDSPYAHLFTTGADAYQSDCVYGDQDY